MQTIVQVVTRTKNSQVASSGFRAEDLFCIQESVKQALGTYFGKEIRTIEKEKPRKKTDLVVTCEDGTVYRIQNKNGSNLRGFSCNRSKLLQLTSDLACQTLLGNVCLKRGEERPLVGKEQSLLLLRTCILGKDPLFEPTHITHTQLKDSTLTSLSICTTEVFLKHLESELYETMLPKKTCVHISPSIYFQRKGGGNKDTSPEDIQTKWKQGTLSKTLFTHLLGDL